MLQAQLSFSAEADTTLASTARVCSESTTLLVREAQGGYRSANAEEVIAAARRVLSARVRRGSSLDSPEAVKTYLTVLMGALEHEVFTVLFVDAQHRLIAVREMFRGTLSQTSVYPREVIKEALALNAGAVFLVHNHPSGVGEPSRADEFLTKQLQAALALVDVRVLDHFIVAGDQVTSFAQRGLL
jgi:DNA repair protein RadC